MQHVFQNNFLFIAVIFIFILIFGFFLFSEKSLAACINGYFKAFPPLICSWCPGYTGNEPDAQGICRFAYEASSCYNELDAKHKSVPATLPNIGTSCVSCPNLSDPNCSFSCTASGSDCVNCPDGSKACVTYCSSIISTIDSDCPSSEPYCAKVRAGLDCTISPYIIPPSPTCAGACTLNKDCGYGCYCYNYSCEQITGCFPDGAQCHSNADCCTNYCDSLGLCACKEPGLFCANNSECCSNICYNNYCCYPDCSCAANTCIGSTCSDGCGGTCAGTKDCAALPAAIGYVNIKHPLGILKLRLISFANALSALKGIIKVARFAGDTNAAADLVEPTDPNASPVRVMTPYGVKAWRREP